MADVKYNLEKLKNAKKEINTLKSDLQTLNKELSSYLETLEKEWHTPAGKEFFENKQVDWSDDVVRYTKMLEGVSEMLQAAINEYEDIDSEAEKLKF